MSIGRGCSQLVFHKQSFEVSYRDAISSDYRSTGDYRSTDVVGRLLRQLVAHARV